MVILITGRIINRLHFPDRLTQIIPTWIPFMIVSEQAIRKETGRVNAPLDCWWCTNSSRYHADRFHTQRKCPKIFTQTLCNVKSNQFNSTPNLIQQWEGTGFHRVANMEEFRNPQPQCAPCLQITGISQNNRGMRKDSARYIRYCLCVKWLIHMPQGQHEWHVQQLFKKYYRENRKSGYQRQIKGYYLGGGVQMARGTSKRINQIHGQVIMAKTPISAV